MNGTIKVRRMFHPKNDTDAWNKETAALERGLSKVRAEAVARLSKMDVPNAVRLQDSQLKRLDAEFANALADHEEAMERRRERLAARFVAGWSGEMWEKQPEKGGFDEKMKMDAFFPAARSEEDDATVPNFFEVDEDGNDKMPLYPGDELFNKAEAIRKEVQALVADGGLSELGRDARIEEANRMVDEKLAAISVRRHPCGGMKLREALSALIMLTAKELQEKHEEQFSL